MKLQLATIAKYFALFLIASCFIFSKCNKEDALGEYYFRCKIDGELYIPNSCANCMQAQILNDTVFIVNGNAGFKSLAIGIYDKDKIGTKTYLLYRIGSGGSYKFSTSSDDIFRTDSLRTGQLIIESLDRPNRTVSGTFYFKAYNPIQDKVVNITEGKFRLKYVGYY